MSRREVVWLTALVLFAGGLLVASWWVDEQADRTNLLNAAANGQVKIAAAAIEDGVSVNFRDRDGCTPLHHAVNRGDVEIVRLLLAHGADPAIPCYDTGRNRPADGSLPLHSAWSPEVITELVAAGANVNAQDAAGNTPLHLAVQYLNSDGVRNLLSHGADPQIRNGVGDFPVDMFAKYALPRYQPLGPRSRDALREIFDVLGPPTQLIDRIVRNMP